MQSPDDFMRSYRELYGDRHAIMWLFHDRCVMCKEKADEINEIIPRARTKQAILDWRNRVALCNPCHSKFHRNGVTLQKQRIMLRKRKEFLISVGRGEYV